MPLYRTRSCAICQCIKARSVIPSAEVHQYLSRVSHHILSVSHHFRYFSGNRLVYLYLRGSTRLLLKSLTCRSEKNSMVKRSNRSLVRLRGDGVAHPFLILPLFFCAGSIFKTSPFHCTLPLNVSEPIPCNPHSMFVKFVAMKV